MTRTDLKPVGEPGPTRAVVLLSGGLDSATCLALAITQGRVCHTLAIDYGQRHRRELELAARLSTAHGAREHRVVRLDLRAIGGSALTDDIAVPKDRPMKSEGTSGGCNSDHESIPVTYVPARNLIFLSLAAALAEVVGARELWIGVNAVDYSGYPDCRPEFIRHFEHTVNLATRAGIEGCGLRVITPLAGLSKHQIIEAGMRLGVDYSRTSSCYDPLADGRSCGHCDACVLRRRGFEEAGLHDPGA